MRPPGEGIADTHPRHLAEPADHIRFKAGFPPLLHAVGPEIPQFAGEQQRDMGTEKDPAPVVNEHLPVMAGAGTNFISWFSNLNRTIPRLRDLPRNPGVGNTRGVGVGGGVGEGMVKRSSDST